MFWWPTYITAISIIVSLTCFVLKVKTVAENDYSTVSPLTDNLSVLELGNGLSTTEDELNVTEGKKLSLNDGKDNVTNVGATTVGMLSPTMEMPFEPDPIFSPAEAVADKALPATTRSNVDSYILDTSLNIGLLAQVGTDVVCGNKALCNKTLSTHTQVCTFECSRCQCDEICHIFGDCCPDVLFRDSHSPPSSPLPVVICLKSVRIAWAGWNSMLVVGMCPENSQQDETVLKKCHQPDLYDVEQATPVSSRGDKVTYKNLYCAFCNGVRDIMPWTLNVRCENTLLSTRRKSREDVWRFVIDEVKHCKISTSPPRGVVVRGCTLDDRDKCNMTGEWKIPDPKIESMCALYNHSVRYYGETNSYKSYKNVFCAVCNGIGINTNIDCFRSQPQIIPHPLKILLAFNPPPVPAPIPVADSLMPRLKTRRKTCGNRQAHDPISMTCRDIMCPERRVTGEDGCIIPFSSASGLGFNFRNILIPVNGSIPVVNSSLSKQYFVSMKQAFIRFSPTLIYDSRVVYYAKQGSPKGVADLIFIDGTIYTLSSKSFSAFEDTLLEFMYQPKMFFGHKKEKIDLSSFPTFCHTPEILSSYKSVLGEVILGSFENLNPICRRIDCSASFAVEDIGLDCPFLEYNISKDNLIFHAENNTFIMNNQVSIQLDQNKLTYCGETLKICLDALPSIPSPQEFVIVTRDDELSFEDDKVLATPDASGTPSSDSDLMMSIISLVCITLSLICLFMTFLVYTVIRKSKNMLSWCTTSMVFYLFWAHLFFLIGFNRSEDATLCKVTGVAIHFLWLASFSWMVVFAYHMHSVFTIPVSLPSAIADVSRFIMYSMFSFVTPIFIVILCVAYYLINSSGIDIGYGGKICFIKEPFGMVIFFVAPLCLALLVNVGFFTRTLLAIRSLPNRKDVSNQSYRMRVFFYIKFSLLLGFTWGFGIIATFLRLEVIWYIFIVLTGSQGVFLFLAHCVNRRTLDMVKSKLACKGETSCSGERHQTENGNKISNLPDSISNGRYVRRESSSL